MSRENFPCGQDWLHAFDNVTQRADVQAVVARLPKVVATDWHRVAAAEVAGADQDGRTVLTAEELAESTGLPVRTIRICRVGLTALGLESVVGICGLDREDRELHIPTYEFVSDLVELWEPFPTGN